MDDEQRHETMSDSEDQVEELLPLEAVDLPPEPADGSADDGISDDAVRLELAFSQPEEAEESPARELDALQGAAPPETDIRIEPSTGEASLSSQEKVFGEPQSPRMLNVGFQPHARKIPIAYESQPSFETPDDVPSAVWHGPYRPDEDPVKVQDMMFRHDDPDNQPRVQLLSETEPSPAPSVRAASDGAAGGESNDPSERGRTLPRLLVTVSMANARSIFQECIERASQSLGAKFHAACQSTVNDYARDRRAAERAASRYGR
jgi:hypothetical protein